MTPKQLQQTSQKIRRHIVDMIYKAKSSHIGCSLGIADILAVLYWNILRIDPQNPHDPKRDRFILSKGHACSALYATLALRGFVDESILKTYLADGSHLAGHVTLGSMPGIEATAGSLGHGVSMAVGMALAAANDTIKNTIYVLIGDGESAEGAIWEGIFLAGHYKLDNLVLIVDANDRQIMGSAHEILNMQPYTEKFKAAGWAAVEVDGHDYTALTKAFKTKHTDKPLAVIAKTIKGKGVSYMEGNYVWHGKCPTEQEYQQALKELS